MLRAIATGSLVTISLMALSTTGTAQSSPTSSSEQEDRRICRSIQETGKLASRRRVCLTRAEWDRAAEEQRRVGQAWVTASDSCADRAEGGFLCK